MSVREGVAPEQVRKPGAVFIILPLLIALLGAAAIYLGGLADARSADMSGYGIDDLAAGMIAAPAESPLER